MEKKTTLVIPRQIQLGDVSIEITFIDSFCDTKNLGEYSTQLNTIKIAIQMSDSAKMETFFHELSEAIADKYCNQPDGTENKVSHEIIDGYGRGIMALIMHNAGRLLK